MADFGFATYFDSDKKLSLELGSPLYMAPEIVNHSKYDSKVDVWSTGVVTHNNQPTDKNMFRDSWEYQLYILAEALLFQ